jgi:hypothetical protein
MSNNDSANPPAGLEAVKLHVTRTRRYRRITPILLGYLSLTAHFISRPASLTVTAGVILLDAVIWITFGSVGTALWVFWRATASRRARAGTSICPVCAGRGSDREAAGWHEIRVVYFKENECENQQAQAEYPSDMRPKIFFRVFIRHDYVIYYKT